MELKMELSQKQILSQHMVQSMEILQMSAQELEGYIEKLALENPGDRTGETSPIKADTQQEDLQRKLDWLESTDLQNRVYYQQERSDENMEANWHDGRQSEENLEEYLHAQLLLADYTDLERAIVDYLVCSLDSKGYFVGILHRSQIIFQYLKKWLRKCCRRSRNWIRQVSAPEIFRNVCCFR